MLLPEPVPGRKTGVLVALLAAVLAAIALLWNVSRRPAHQPAAMAETIDDVAPAAAVPPPTGDPETPNAVAPVLPPDETAEPDSSRNQAAITRVIREGRPFLHACYQRALSRDSTLVQARMKVRVSVSASGKVTRVAVRGPAAFRDLEPCLEQVISRWTFPADSNAYVAEFPVAFRAKE